MELLKYFVVHRDEFWWDKPEFFFPERFSKENPKQNSHTFDFIPFSGGLRSCWQNMTFG